MREMHLVKLSLGQVNATFCRLPANLKYRCTMWSANFFRTCTAGSLYDLCIDSTFISVSGHDGLVFWSTELLLTHIFFLR